MIQGVWGCSREPHGLTQAVEGRAVQFSFPPSLFSGTNESVLNLSIFLGRALVSESIAVQDGI